MESRFNHQVKKLYEKAGEIIETSAMLKANRAGDKLEIQWPSDFEREFFDLVSQVSLSLMQEKEDFYGYFLIQMNRELRVDMSSPTGINFKGAKYVIYFNPIIFLNLTLKQMATTIKHEILHAISKHLIRAKAVGNEYSTLAMNMAMDVVVNQFLDYLPPYATTLESVNLHYELKLKPYETFEYYVDKIQTALNLAEEDEEGEENDLPQNEDTKTQYDPEKTHDLWMESDELDEKTISELTEKLIDQALKGKVPVYLEEMIAAFKSSKGELPWNLYLNQLMGTVESNKKKVVTRRNRRQPERLDLRGNLRSHKAEIAVALDVSGSISNEEFRQALQEVLQIVKNYNHEITLIECDSEVRRAYKIKSTKDIKERVAIGGGTRFTPVFEFANKKNINLLIYFTDGKGEERLKVVPRGYKVLWVISGRGDELSLKEPYGAVKKLKKIEVKDIGLEMSDIRSDGYSMNNQAPSF